MQDRMRVVRTATALSGRLARKTTDTKGTRMIDFKLQPEEFAVVERIACRALDMADRFNVDYTKTEAVMDLTACHRNGCPLSLDELEVAPDGDFAHDVFGIRRHINRETGALEDCFMPRFAAAYHTARAAS